MKVALINPAFYDGKQFRNRFEDYLDWIKGGNLYVAPFEPPLGLAYLSSALKAKGHEVKLIDMQGLLMDSVELSRELKEFGPRLVGITAMTPTVPEALRVARNVRESTPSAEIVLGGVHPTIDPDGMLSQSEVDYVVRGEGELVVTALAEALETGGALDLIDGLSYKKHEAPVIKGKAHAIDDLDALPLADYEAFPVGRYVDHNAHLRNIRGISMLIGRGCPFQCTFCAVRETMGLKWRSRSPERVVNQIIELRDKYHIEGVWFKDSTFNLNRKWCARIRPAHDREACRGQIPDPHQG